MTARTLSALISAAVFSIPTIAHAQGVGTGWHVDSFVQPWLLWVGGQGLFSVAAFFLYDRFKAPLGSRFLPSVFAFVVAFVSNVFFTIVTVVYALFDVENAIWVWGIGILGTSIIQLGYTVMAIREIKPDPVSTTDGLDDVA